ncbi:MAG: DUF4331 family protein [Candidatus Sericytochromatia bacterium]
MTTQQIRLLVSALALTLAACQNTGSTTNPVMQPSALPSALPTTLAPSAMPTAEPSATQMPSATPLPSASPLPSAQPSALPTVMATATPQPTPTPTPQPTPTATPRSSSGSGRGNGGAGASNRIVYVQMERLARPAINEGLIITNDLLNLWNSVPPAVDATSAAAPIAAEARAVLKALTNTDEEVDGLFGALLPDVMRIDTTIDSGYVSAVNSSGSPIGGRMIEDDVIDITLSLVVPDSLPSGLRATLETDYVSYDGPNANGSAHQPVLASFPYLAAPN